MQDSFFDTDFEYKDRTIDGLFFEQTCLACPEQYDVFDVSDSDRKKQIGYVRMRWGACRAYYPDYTIDSKLIYEHYFDDELLGVFPSEEDRVVCLTEIAKRINQVRMGISD